MPKFMNAKITRKKEEEKQMNNQQKILESTQDKNASKTKPIYMKRAMVLM